MLTWIFALLLLANNSVLLHVTKASEAPAPRVRNRSAAEVLTQRAIKEAVQEKVTNYEESKLPLAKRVLVVYQVGLLSLDFSADVIVNNLKIFSSAIHSHVDSVHSEALYIFNIVGGDTNPFYKYLPCSSINTICVKFDREATVDLEALTDLDTHREVVDTLGDAVLSKFQHVLFLNQEARGPFEKLNNGEWLTKFTALMDQPNKGLANTALLSSYGHHMVPIASTYEVNSTLSIGAVGVGMSCDPEPRLLTHAFMLASRHVVTSFGAVARATVTHEVQGTTTGDGSTSRVGAQATALTMHLLREGVSIATLVQQARFSPSSLSLRPEVADQVASEFEQENPAGEYVPHVLGDSTHPAPLPGTGTGAATTAAAAAAAAAEKEREGEEPPEPAATEDTIHDHAITHLRPMSEKEHRMLTSTIKGGTKGTSNKAASWFTPSKKKPSSAPVRPLLDPVDSALYKNMCLTAAATMRTSSNPILWCNLLPSEMLFVRYGGSVLRTPGILCEDTMKAVTDATIALVETVPHLRLRLPENPYGGVYRDLYAQYSRELWQWQLVPKYEAARSKRERKKDDKHGDKKHHRGSDRHSDKHGGSHLQRNTRNKRSDAQVLHYDESGTENVCFLIRSAHVHSLKQAPGKPPSRLVKMDLKLLIQTLIRQVNPHWHAYFLVTDEKPFEDELRQILGGFADRRLHFLDIPRTHRPPFTVIDAGYTATDYGLNLLFAKPECRYISVSNADNAYGSHIVESVLHARNNAVTGQPADMLLAPLDSRNFAESDYRLRARLRGGKAGGWRERCVGVETSLKLQGFVYTIQTLPILGRVDLAAVFFSASKWRDERLLFGNFSDVNKYNCKGCQDGYLTEALVTQRFWSYVQLPIDGMRSMVFHGPSPTLCVASGNVWFDFPEVNKLGCVSHRTIGSLHASPFYDLARFYEPKSPRVCMRLTQKGFWNRTASIIT